MSRAGGASGRTASIVATMAAWLCLGPACGRLGYTPIDPAIADGPSSTGGSGGAGGAGGSNTGTDATGGSGSTGGGAGGTGGAGTGGGAGGGAGGTAGDAGGASLDSNVIAGMGGSGMPATGGTSGSGGASGGSGGSGGSGVDAQMDRAADLPPDTAPPASSITLIGGSATARRGNPAMGTQSMASCPSDQVVIGFEGFHGRNQVYPWLHSAGALCGAVTINGSTVTIAEAGKLPVVGATSGVAWTRRCPSGQVIIGFEGNAGDWMGIIRLRCAVLLASASATLTTSAGTTLEPVGAPADNTFPATDCPTGQVARGQDLSAGTWLSSFGLLCATPQRR